ncbi:MAG TPA: CvpA family protein [bacterium]|nr:CvpA family protein [bacterium]
MNLLDLVIILTLIIHMVIGWRKGMFGLLGEVGGLILGLWLGTNYSKTVAGFVSSYLVGPAWLLLLLAFLGLFVSGLFATRMAVTALKRLVSIPGLSSIDGFIGAAMGLAAGSLVAILLIGLLAYLPWPYLAKLIQSSEIGQYFWSVTPVFNRYLWKELWLRLPRPHTGLQTRVGKF